MNRSNPRAPFRNHKAENKYQMPRLKNKVIERIPEFRTAWRELAPEAMFAGMTLVQFEAAIAPPETVRAEIAALAKQLEGRKTQRSIADVAAGKMLELVINSVRGTPGYGPDSELYRAFGYVRKSERKSGLGRKRKNPADTTENADAA